MRVFRIDCRRSFVLACVLATHAPLMLPSVSFAESPGLQAYLEGLDALEQAQWNDATAAFGKALEAEGENADYWTARGVANTLGERLNDAIKDLDRANRLRPNDKATRLWLATAIAMQGRFTDGTNVYPFATRDQYESAVRRMSHEYGEVAFRRAMGDPLAVKQAMPAFENAKRQFPVLAKQFVQRAKPAGANISSALRDRGIQRYNARQYAQASDDLAHARQANPDDIEVIYYHAGCKLALGSPEGARADYTQALTANTKWANAYLGRALAHAALGSAPRARSDFANAQRIDVKTAAVYEPHLNQRLAQLGTIPPRNARVALLDELFQAAKKGADDNALQELAGALVRAMHSDRLRSDERYQDGLRVLRAAVEAEPNNADRFAALGEYLYTESQIVLGEAVEPRAVHRPYRPQTEQSQKRELAEAERVLDAALQLNPKQARALAFKGACLMKRFAWNEAEVLLTKALSLSPRDPMVLELFAQVMDHAAMVAAANAADLRSVDSWSDYYYIYYRYPSQAELEMAAQLEAQARRLWQMARQALLAASEAEPGKPTSFYYRAVVAERDKDFAAARTNLEQALRLDASYLAAWQRLCVTYGRLGMTNEAYAAQSAAANLTHTTAASMLKLAWIHIVRTGFQSAGTALDHATQIDPADPRVATYRGAIAREQGQYQDAAAWFLAAIALEEVNANMNGLGLRSDGKSQLGPGQVARPMMLNLAAGEMLLKLKQAQRSLHVLQPTFGLYERIAVADRYPQLATGMLPSVPADPTRLPNAPSVEGLACWTALRMGEAQAMMKSWDNAIKSFTWANLYEQRKPPTADPGPTLVLREPAIYARIGIVRVELARGNVQQARVALQMVGRPRDISPEAQAELERLRTEVDRATGGASSRDDQTYQGMLERLRREQQQQDE